MEVDVVSGFIVFYLFGLVDGWDDGRWVGVDIVRVWYWKGSGSVNL